jgi:hypothetical protein
MFTASMQQATHDLKYNKTVGGLIVSAPVMGTGDAQKLELRTVVGVSF